MRVLLALCAFTAAQAESSFRLASKVTVYDTEGQPAASISGVLSKDGPDIGAMGMVGKMVVSDPDLFACNGQLSTVSTLMRGLFMASEGVRPVALIERSSPDLAESEQCTFEDKVRAVQSAGAAAAIIFDYKREEAVVMSYPHPEGIDIPAVFISNEAGQALVDAIERTGSSVQPIVHIMSGPQSNGGLKESVTAWAYINTIQFEYLSFTTGYTLLALCIIPVGLVNMLKALRRRRKVEAVYSFLFHNDQLKTKLMELYPNTNELPASIPNIFPLPLPLGAGKVTPCMRAHRFLVLVLICFLWQVVCQSMWFDQNPTIAAQETRGDAMSMGYGLVVQSVVMACAIIVLRTLLGCVCGCCSVLCCRRVRSSSSATSTASDESGDYVALASNGKEDKTTTKVFVGMPLSLHELKDLKEKQDQDQV
jgi:hypothetical protein